MFAEHQLPCNSLTDVTRRRSNSQGPDPRPLDCRHVPPRGVDESSLGDTIHRLGQASVRVSDIWFALRNNVVIDVSDEAEVCNYNSASSSPSTTSRTLSTVQNGTREFMTKAAEVIYLVTIKPCVNHSRFV